MNNDKVNCVGAEEAAGPNQQQGTYSQAHTIGIHWSNNYIYSLKKYIATKLSKYVWSYNLFVKNEYYISNKRVDPIMCECMMKKKK